MALKTKHIIYFKYEIYKRPSALTILNEPVERSDGENKVCLMIRHVTVRIDNNNVVAVTCLKKPVPSRQYSMQVQYTGMQSTLLLSHNHILSYHKSLLLSPALS